MAIKIVAMGDSTTAGTPGFLSPLEAPPKGAGDEESQYAHWLMKWHANWKVLNKGINGERSDQILSRFERDVIREGPMLVVILAGVNDIYQGHPPEHPEGNLSKMYAMASIAGIVPVSCTVLPYNTMGGREAEVRRKLNAWVRTQSQELGIPFCDTADSASDPGNRDRLVGSPDGLHPDVAGYRKMAEAISRTVEDYLSHIEGERSR